MDTASEGWAGSLDSYQAWRAAEAEAELDGRVLPFDAAEYAGRLGRLQAAMAEAGVDTVLLSRPESICWLTGYAARWYRQAGPPEWPGLITVAVRGDRDDIHHFDFNGEQEAIALTSACTHVCILREDGTTLEHFVAELKARGLLGGVIGRELRSPLPDRVVALELEGMLEAAGSRVTDIDPLVNGLRRLKSPAELERTEQAARIGDIGLRAAQAFIAPGVTELEVWGEMMRAMAAAGGEPGAIHEMVMAGPVFLPHVYSRRRPMKRGDLVAVDPCGVVDRYHANVSRTFCIGEPPEELLQASRATAGTVPLICAAMRAGRTIEEVAREMRAGLEAAHVWDDVYWVGGYELGISFPPDWVGPWIFDLNRPDAGRCFEAGMVTNLEVITQSLPIVDTLVHGPDGARALSSLPRELVIVDA